MDPPPVPARGLPRATSAEAGPDRTAPRTLSVQRASSSSAPLIVGTYAAMQALQPQSFAMARNHMAGGTSSTSASLPNEDYQANPHSVYLNDNHIVIFHGRLTTSSIPELDLEQQENFPRPRSLRRLFPIIEGVSGDSQAMQDVPRTADEERRQDPPGICGYTDLWPGTSIFKSHHSLPPCSLVYGK